MGKITPLILAKSVAFDTPPLIYYLEEHPIYLAIVDELFNAIDLGSVRGMTSVLTLLEVLISRCEKGGSSLQTNTEKC